MTIQAPHPEAPKEGDARNWRISVTQGMRGWFAVMLAEFYCSEFGDWIIEPWTSGIHSWATREEAVKDGKAWAEDEEMPFAE